MKYKNMYIIILLSILISVWLFFTIKSEDIKNLVGNILAGLITGLVLALLSNKRNSEIYINEEKISQYSEIIKRKNKLNRKLVDILDNDNIDIRDLINVFVDFEQLYSDFNNVDEEKIKVIKKDINFEDNEKEIFLLIGKLASKILENTITRDEFEKFYERYIRKYQIEIINLSQCINENLEIINKNKENLKKGII
ncbi:MAG: hypothetical protein HFJ41_03435 [Clostridia bacterium]|nr:hypothetical protein [Clostridia bacterium]